MRSLVRIFMICSLCCSFLNDAAAQSKNAFAYRFNWLNYNAPRPDQLGKIFSEYDLHAAEVAYQRNISGNTFLVLPAKVGLAAIPSVSNQSDRRYLITTLDLMLQQHFAKWGKAVVPYGHAGIGGLYNWNENKAGVNFPLGVGLNFKVMEGFYFNAQTQYRLSTNKQDAWHHGLGFVLTLGAQEPPAPTAPPTPADRDKDGIPDALDRCPDDIGTAAMNGCPDRDADGIGDNEDRCPDKPGPVSLNGCPDSDGDGIGDAEDACPTVKGIAALRGCPDSDGDGIGDAEDACPTVKGAASAKGCPDRDGDAIADKDDACPDKPGAASHKGCPDSDGDGVYDNEDRCVDKAGPASNKGCPEISKEDQAKLQNVIKNVQFESNRAVLLPKSYPVLDEVVDLLKRYPEYNLRISGHTDNTGDDKANLTLSERRAKTCYDYLVSKGIAAARMSHTGYGETRPIGDNATAAGREKNRRVDFDLFVP